MSLRLKITCALLATGLLSVFLMWTVAHDRLMARFDNLRAANSSRNFREDVAAYWLAYGSWDAGALEEPFGRFARRRREESGPPPDAPQRGPGAPPFRFLLFTPAGRVLNAAPPYQPGDIVKSSDRRNAVPVEVEGSIVAFASPTGTINYTESETKYLDAMQAALLSGIAASAGLALVLGLALGSGLSRPLIRLTRAIREMQNGAVRVKVPVGSRDEVGLLAEAFNTMSEKLAEQSERLQEMALRDSLTGLFNRRHFDAAADQLYDQAKRYSHPLCLMVGDLDHFKQVNDRFSHAVGDAVLREIGALLIRHLRTSDLVARYGGEEFVVAFPHNSLAEAAALCERLRYLIETHDWSAIHPGLSVTMSMGVSDDLSLGSVEAMLKSADRHLYEAKEAGRNQIRSRLALEVD